MQEKTADTANSIVPLINMFNGALNNTDFSNMDSIINQSNKMANSRHIVSDIINNPSKASFSNLFADILNFLIFIALIPAVHSRLRDIGKSDSNTIWTYTGLIYTTVIFSALDTILGISIPFFFILIAGIASFGVISWLCMAKGKEVTPPHLRGHE